MQEGKNEGMNDQKIFQHQTKTEKAKPEEICFLLGFCESDANQSCQKYF